MKKEALHPSYKSVTVIGTTVQSPFWQTRYNIRASLLDENRSALFSFPSKILHINHVNIWAYA